jgi:hypothetical protein
MAAILSQIKGRRLRIFWLVALSAICTVVFGVFLFQQDGGTDKSNSNAGTDASPQGGNAVEPSSIDDLFPVAYGINSMVHTLDYCLITIEGQIVAFHYVNSNVFNDLWLRSVYHVPDSDMNKLRQLLGNANVAGLADEYHANMVADGTLQYLAIPLNGGTKTIYFNNKIPASAKALISYLDALMEKATTLGSSETVSYSDAEKDCPFPAFR